MKTFGSFKLLTGEEEKTITQVTEILRSRVQNGCTGCRYCMPCPAGVDIPGCFASWNTYHMYQNYNVVKWRWGRRWEKESRLREDITGGKRRWSTDIKR